MRRKEITIPTLIGLFVAVVGLASGLLLLKGQLGQRAAASAEETPINVKISNVTDTSFTVTWTSAKSLPGFIQYGEGTADPDLVVSDERDQQKGAIGNYFTHYVTVRGLRPATSYQFMVGSGKSMFGNPSVPYRLTTAPGLTNTPPADVAYGQVVTANNEPADGTLIYIEMQGMSPQTTLVRSTGSWVIPLATARSVDLKNYVQYDKQNGEFTITADGGPLGMASAKVALVNNSPVPQITLGQTYQFTDKEVTGTEKFRGLGTTNGTGPVKLLTPQIGERVNSLRPVILGEAPAGTELTIEVHSDEAITGKVVTTADGKFNYTVPTDLAPGTHTVTVSALVNGVLQKVTSSFAVYAQGESTVPYYSATPSASISPSPTSKTSPTPTRKPTVSPTPIGGSAVTGTTTPTKSPTPTRTPTPTTPPRTYNPATDSALPNTGAEDYTFIVLISGALLIGFGAWRYSKIA